MLLYVGMNDICSPMIILFEDEADAFWCFERAMRRLVRTPLTFHVLFCPYQTVDCPHGFLFLFEFQRENFRATATSMGVQTQLGVLSQVIKTVDPRLHQHLGKCLVLCCIHSSCWLVN